MCTTECLECETKCERDDPVSVHSTTIYSKFKWEIVNTDKPTNQQQQNWTEEEKKRANSKHAKQI